MGGQHGRTALPSSRMASGTSSTGWANAPSISASDASLSSLDQET